MKTKLINDLRLRDLTQFTREELYEEVIFNQKFAVDVLSKLDWIIGAFMSTLETDFHFGKQRMRKLLKGVSNRFKLYSDWPSAGLYGDLNYQYLEKFNYKLSFKGHHFLLRDLKEDPRNYFDDLVPGLEELAHKIKHGKELTEDEIQILGVVREAEND